MSRSASDVAASVAVLDIEKHGGRRLAETVEGTGLTALEYNNVTDLGDALVAGDATIGVVAFEALWPDPQRTLRKLRARTGNRRLVVIYSEGAPRWQLGQRLWAVGLFDFYTPRSTPPHEMRPILRQAYADSLIDSGQIAEGTTEDTETANLHRKIRSLSTLGAAFAGQQHVEGLLRELQTRLPQLVDYNLLEVLVTTDDEKPRLFLSQTRPVDHEDIWGLAGEICTAVAPLIDGDLNPESLMFEGGAPVGSARSAAPAGRQAVVTIPMVIGGRLVGCMGLRLPSEESADDRTTLQIVASHLGTSLRNAQSIENAESQALTDELTGAHNRRFLRRVFEGEWRRCERYEQALSVAMVDIDHFKQINDTHGHLVGDAVLRNLVDLMTVEMREVDYVVRYGGEEFVILLPQTGASEAMLVLERMRSRVAATPIYSSEKTGPITITVSAGIAAYPTTAVSAPGHLLEFADQALYESKRGGRNRVTVSSGRSLSPSTSSPPSDTGSERRAFPRIGTEVSVRYVPLPSLDGHIMQLESTDVSAGGLAVRGPEHQLQINSMALVYLGDHDKPLLARVVWTRATESGDHLAGLRYLSFRDLRAGSPSQRNKERALVISESARIRGQVQRVLRAAQCDTDVVGDESELDLEGLRHYSLFVVGESKLRGSLGGLIKELRQNPNVRIVVINESEDRKAALGTIHSEQVNHLVPSPATEEALFATLNKLLLGEYFGIKKYLLWGAVTNSWRLERSDEKQQVLDGIIAMAKEVKCHPRIIDSLVAAVDEMIINALFRPSTASEATRPVTVECGSDGRLLAVGVVDEHGELSQDDIFEGIGAALESQDHGIPEGATHAHLGFRIMLDALSQLSVNVDPGRCTEIIGIIDLRRTLREHRSSVPGLGLFRK